MNHTQNAPSTLRTIPTGNSPPYPKVSAMAPPTAGATIELTIDEFLQHIAERELHAGVIENRAVGGTAIVAWDGKEPSSRAARRAVALLKKASKIVIVGSPSGDAPADLNRLAGYYAAHGLEASVEIFPKGDILQQLIEANARHGADYMVAGAFGRSRLREFAFGGTTRALLQTTQLNLYMAH